MTTKTADKIRFNDIILVQGDEYQVTSIRTTRNQYLSTTIRFNAIDLNRGGSTQLSPIPETATLEVTWSQCSNCEDLAEAPLTLCATCTN